MTRTKRQLFLTDMEGSNIPWANMVFNIPRPKEEVMSVFGIFVTIDNDTSSP